MELRTIGGGSVGTKTGSELPQLESGLDLDLGLDELDSTERSFQS